MRNSYAIAVIIAVVALAGSREVASAEPQAGEVLALFGQCLGETGGGRKLLRPGDAVYVGETLEVAAGAKLKLRMNDGSIIVADESHLTIADYRVGNGGQSRDAILSLGAGLLRAVVSVLKGSPHFEVDTATGVAAVRSTDWFVEAQPGSTQVGVLEGRVSLQSVATGREIVIPAHWGARVEAGRDPVPARVWSAAEFDNFIRRTPAFGVKAPSVAASAGYHIFNGHGTGTDFVTFTVNGVNQNVPSPVSITYTVNSDCTGTYSVQNGPDFDIFVAVDGSELSVIVTDPDVSFSEGPNQRVGSSRRAQ